VKPNSLSAAGFHDVILDSGSVITMAVGLISRRDSK
jgi:hypothetical protein